MARKRKIHGAAFKAQVALAAHYFMKPRPLAVDPTSFERSGVHSPGDRPRLGILSVIPE
jgi:hypothetical protein